ncbi:MAG: hypothetical protein AAGF29_06135 [Pseudomonadota bacterium]
MNTRHANKKKTLPHIAQKLPMLAMMKQMADATKRSHPAKSIWRLVIGADALHEISKIACSQLSFKNTPMALCSLELVETGTSMQVYRAGDDLSRRRVGGQCKLSVVSFGTH